MSRFTPSFARVALGGIVALFGFGSLVMSLVHLVNYLLLASPADRADFAQGTLMVMGRPYDGNPIILLAAYLVIYAMIGTAGLLIIRQARKPARIP